MNFKNEKIVEIKICQKCQLSFDVTDKDLEFYHTVSPTFAWKKYAIPSPTLCPDCRQQRRLSWYNESQLYKTQCHYTKKPIISMHRPGVPYIVYDIKEWMWDSFDGFDTGKDFDFDRPFFEQWDELLKSTPIPNRDVFELTNSEYTNYAGYLKDCYLIFQSDENENCCYGKFYFRSKNSYDCFGLYDSDNCYECVDCINSFGLFFSENTKDSSNSYFLKNCVSCNDCYGCVNMNNAQYCIFNKQYSKEEYKQYIENRPHKNMWDLKIYKQEFQDFSAKNIMKNLNNIWCENTLWERNFHSKNIINGYDNIEVEEWKYISVVRWGKQVMDINCFGGNLNQSYEWLVVWMNSSNICYSYSCWGNVSHIFYSYFCIVWCKDCFGCVWLKGQQYCILNKQYSKQEYEELVPKIIEHMRSTWEWWEFFPSSLSPFGYNETVATEYFPLDPAQSENQWFNWSDYASPTPNVVKTIPADKLPDSIDDIPDDILNWAIICEITGKTFTIIAWELAFYRKYQLPIPRRHPDQRHLDRMNLRNPRKLFERDCDKCWIGMQTTYAPERPEKVYCEECYNKEIY